MSLKKEEILNYIVVAIFAALIFVGLKYRMIARSISGVSPLYSVWGYCFQDIIIWIILSAPILLFKKTFKLILLPIFFLFTVNIIFISKTGYPMSASLFSQMGDLMMLQTSISSPSVYRNFVLLGGSNLIFMIVVIFPFRKFIKKISIPIYTCAIFISIITLASTILPSHSKISRLSTNLLVALLKPPRSTKNILEKKIFKNFQFQKWEKEITKAGVSKRKNIVLIIVETLKADIPNFKETMPFLFELSKSSKVYKKHYTPWPFSSKALFSIFCSQPPMLSSVIEMRIGTDYECQNWMGLLSRDYSYRGFLGYTGDLRYDNMKGFFSRLAPIDMFDRNNIGNAKNYVSNRLSLDDQAMIDQFLDWLDKDKRSIPFYANFITMNSHYPFWVPHKQFEKTKDPYRDALFYQDHIIKNIFNDLKKRDLLKNTIFVVTGDHGRREADLAKSMIPKSMYHVPLIWFEDNQTEEIFEPTSHYLIGSSLIKSAIGSYYGIKNFNLESKVPVFSFFESDELLFTILSQNKKMTYNGDETIFFSSKEWPNSQSDRCDFKNCQSLFGEFYEYFSNLEDIYENK